MFVLEGQQELVIEDVQTLKEALSLAEGVFSQDWLIKEFKKPHTSPLLNSKENSVLSHRRTIHRLKFGFESRMHPLAEAILIAKKVIENFYKSGNLIIDPSIFKVFSLADIAQHQHKVKNIKQKIVKLSDYKEWFSAIYEIFVGMSYALKGCSVDFLNESKQKTCDLKIIYENETHFIECKSIIKKSDKQINEAVKKWQKNFLSKIEDIANRKYVGGFLIQVIAFSSNFEKANIPNIIKNMIQDGKELYKDTRLEISITPFEEKEYQLPKKYSALDKDLWGLIFDFSSEDWSKWDDVFPTCKFKVANFSNVIVNSVKEPVLICFKADYLTAKAIDVSNAIKKASKQLPENSIGTIHLYIKDSNLVKDDILIESARQAFKNSSRIHRVVFNKCHKNINYGNGGQTGNSLSFAVTRQNESSNLPKPMGFII